MRRLLSAFLAVLVAAQGPVAAQTVAEEVALAEPAPEVPDLRPRPRPEDLDGRRKCTPDGRHCISLDSYVADVCSLIAEASETAGIDTGFFARLLWKESLFDASAVSHAGAQGIAQFMPQTAKLRGLADPFNPAEAIVASAEYLAEMARDYGSLGMAAIGYNGGEDRAERFIADGAAFLPAETLNYVASITGHPASAWRETPPGDVDYRLDGETPFQEACRRQAENRAITEFRDPMPAWGVIVAAARRHATAQQFGAEAKRRNAGIIGGVELRIVQARMPGFGNERRYTAQVPAGSRDEALALCRRLQSAGGFCRVQRN